MIYLAGLLHDLGKLAVPTEILEKPEKLTPKEYDIVRRHTYYTYYILEPLKILNMVRIWGAFHHERVDGRGYPFHLSEAELPLGSRIISIADIFTALTEDRPYRKGSEAKEAFKILLEASSLHRVDSQVTSILQEHLAEVNEVRRSAQIAAEEEYRQFIETYKKLIPTTTAGSDQFES